MKELDNNRIEELLPRYCEGRLSEGERLEVEAWIDESEENKRVATQTFALYLAVDTVQVMARQPVRDTRVRKLVQEQQGQVSKAVRCRYIEEFQREASRTGILRQSLVLILALSKCLIMMQLYL